MKSSKPMRMETVTGKRGAMAQRSRTPEEHGYGNTNKRRYDALVNPDERNGRDMPTRSGGARHRVLSEQQFRTASQKKAR